MNGFDFPVEVVRTDRKKSASILLKGGGVQVRVPKHVSEQRIRELITGRTPWITRKLKEAAARTPVKPREFAGGETFCCLGRDYRLKVGVGEERSVELNGSYLHTRVLKTDAKTREVVRALLAGWYREQAQRHLGEKTEKFSKLIGVSPKSITIKDYKSRWGSCSAKGDISYNWKIILAPHRIVDYVVVHELCHLLEHNHSSRYWRHVERIVPDYRERRKWLNTESERLIARF